MDRNGPKWVWAPGHCFIFVLQKAETVRKKLRISPPVILHDHMHYTKVVFFLKDKHRSFELSN